MHKGTTHTGKIPVKAVQRRSAEEQLAILEDDIQAAVKAERYEDAAKIRDQINQLKQDVEHPSA